MKIYLAGTPGTIQREREWQKSIQKRLLSYWDIQQEQFAVKEAFYLIKRGENENLACGSSRRKKSRRL